MKQKLTALTVAATMFASGTSAFDPDDLQKLKDSNKCAECNLEVVDLMGANLSGALVLVLMDSRHCPIQSNI